MGGFEASKRPQPAGWRGRATEAGTQKGWTILKWRSVQLKLLAHTPVYSQGAEERDGSAVGTAVLVRTLRRRLDPSIAQLMCLSARWHSATPQVSLLCKPACQRCKQAPCSIQLVRVA